MSSFIAALHIVTASFLYIDEAIVNMRESPDSESKVVSQTIFSENISVKKECEGWAYIVTSDEYTGWVPVNSFIRLKEPYEPNLKVSRLAAHIYAIKDVEFGPLKTLPYGSKLQALDETDPRWIKIALMDGKECYIQKGDVTVEQELHNKKELAAFSKKFLGLPYTWGGRSSFGYDCSGFVQMLCNQIGISLPRDSKQQIQDKRFQTISIEDLKTGDLLFFGKSQDKIAHVGMYLGNGQFIHSTVREHQPWIRISHLTDFEWSGHAEAFYSYRIARQLY